VSTMAFALEPASAVPLYQQIRDALRAQIDAGALPAGRRLPSSRQLARDLGVSRVTTASAYAELEAEGLVEPRAGSGTHAAPPRLGRLRGRAVDAGPPARERPGRRAAAALAVGARAGRQRRSGAHAQRRDPLRPEHRLVRLGARRRDALPDRRAAPRDRRRD